MSFHFVLQCPMASTHMAQAILKVVYSALVKILISNNRALIYSVLIPALSFQVIPNLVNSVSVHAA
jgi:hypothetical protein